jgi:Ca2+-binding RTX toxin-like protein
VTDQFPSKTQKDFHMSIIGKFLANQHQLLFTGDSGDNSIIVSRDAAGDLFGNGGAIHISPEGATVANTDLIRINAGDGNDVVALDQTNGTLPAAQIFGGDGNDSLTGGSGNDLLSGQGGNDSLFGGAGNDTLLGGAGNDFVVGGTGADVANLGSGNDVFVWNQGDGSDKVEGGTGHDELLFNGAAGAEQFTLSASGGDALLTRVQGNIVMDLHSVENITLNPLAGADTININDLSGSGLTDVDLNLGFDGASDTINISDDDHVSVVNNGNGNLTITGVSGATVHVTGFETANDHLVINGDAFVF